MVIEADGFRVYDPATLSFSTPLMEPPQGEGWPQGEEELSDQVLEGFLRRATITGTISGEVEGLPIRILELELKDMRLRAWFTFSQETPEEAAAAGRKAQRRYQHHVAAYRLDRRMRLDLVPVTVLRTVDGQDGNLSM